MNDAEFDMFLENIAEASCPSDMSQDINPWHRAMSRVLWGTGLTTLTLNFLNLDTILSGIGLILLILGYRALRKENGWFRAAYIVSVLRAIWFCITFFLQSTVLSEADGISLFLSAGAYLCLVLLFFCLLSLRNGIRAVQKKAGLPGHGGTELLLWYGIVLLLALIKLESIAVFILVIAYGFILRGLFQLSAELTQAGYAISPSAVKISDRTVALTFGGILLALYMTGLLFLGRYPMEWQPVDASRSGQAADVSEKLTALGFPENVLRDMTAEEILACKDAAFVLVHSRDYDINLQRGIGTQEEIDGSKVALITPDEGEPHLRFTFIGVKFGDAREHWRIIHHFEWLTDTRFFGTEAIQLWPSDRSGAWDKCTDVTGRLLYDKGDVVLTADYYSLQAVSYRRNDILAGMTGRYDNHDVFATFSFPGEGERQRGYLIYDIREMKDGAIVDSWFNYAHQQRRLQFPVMTARDYFMTSFLSRPDTFWRIQSALQFTTHGAVPELFCAFLTVRSVS